MALRDANHPKQPSCPGGPAGKQRESTALQVTFERAAHDFARPDSHVRECRTEMNRDTIWETENRSAAPLPLSCGRRRRRHGSNSRIQRHQHHRFSSRLFWETPSLRPADGRCCVNHCAAASATHSSVPGSSKRCVAPGMTSSSLRARSLL